MSRSTISTFQLFATFPDEESAREYLEGRLWADGAKCPECKGKERITARKDGYYRCNACRLDFTIRTGTIFERLHVPLHKWVYAMYLVVTARKGISSLQLSKEIGVTQKSAWFMLQRLCPRGDRMKKLCDCGFPQSSPVPHEHSRRPVPPELDAIADAVLAYKPKPKTKAAKRRKRRAQKAKRKSR